MASYHVGCGITAIWAGTLNKAGDKWSNKSEVTDEACSAVALVASGERLEYSDGYADGYNDAKREEMEV